MAEDFGPYGQSDGFRTEGMDLSVPAVDLFEEKDDIVVKAEIKGMDKDNIQVNLTDHTLTIQRRKEKSRRGQARELLSCRTELWLVHENAGVAEGRPCG